MFSSLNLHPAGKGKGHRAPPMHRDLLDQVSPIVSAEIGNAVGHGFDFQNEILNLLVVLFLLVEAFLCFSQ